MKLNRKSLLEALSAASTVVDKKAPQSILANVLARPREGGLEVIATDLRSTSSTIVGCEDPAEFCAPAGDLYAVVAGLSCEDVAIKVDAARIVISGGGAKFTLGADDPKFFPAVPDFNAAKAASMDAGALATVIAGTSYAASFDKAHLSGVFVTVAGDNLESVATDGQRMALRRVKGGNLKPCLIPTGAANSMAKILDGHESCSVHADADVIQVRAGESTLSSKLIESTFIPYQQFIGPNAWSDTPAIVNRANLAAMLKRALIIRATGKTGIQFGDITIGKGKIELVREDEANKVEESIKCDGGSKADSHLNLRFMLDAIDHMDAEDVEVHITGEFNPVIIRDKNNEQIGIVMPASK